MRVNIKYLCSSHNPLVKVRSVVQISWFYGSKWGYTVPLCPSFHFFLLRLLFHMYTWLLFIHAPATHTHAHTHTHTQTCYTIITKTYTAKDMGRQPHMQTNQSSGLVILQCGRCLSSSSWNFHNSVQCFRLMWNKAHHTINLWWQETFILKHI